MCSRFVSVFELDEELPLKDTVLLALAADEYLMEPLRNWCCFRIYMMVKLENVWQTLNSTCLVPKMGAMCCKVINFFENN